MIDGGCVGRMGFGSEFWVFEVGLRKEMNRS